MIYDSDPDDKGHECMPYVLRCMPTKHIAAIHIALEIKGRDLLDLPTWMHWHAPVGLRNVDLPENGVEIRFLLPQIAKSIAQIMDIVQGDSSDVLT